jgi:hypothetical protein
MYRIETNKGVLHTNGFKDEAAVVAHFSRWGYVIHLIEKI